MILFFDTAGVFYINAGCYVCAVICVAMIGTEGRPTSQHLKSVTGDIREGLSYAARNPTILSLIITLFVPALFGFPFIALLPAWAREALNVQSDSLGILMMMMGIGSLIGSLILASMSGFQRRGLLLLVIGIAWGIVLTLFSQSESYEMAIPCLMLLGLLSAGFMSLNMTLLQIYTVSEMRGRMMSLSMMTFGAMPLSVVPFGAIAEKIGTPNALTLGGLILSGFAVAFTLLHPKFRKIL